MIETLLFFRAGEERLPPLLRRRYDVLPVRLTADRKTGDYFTDIKTLRTLLGPGWTSQSFDLLNFSCALRAADRYFISEGLFRARRNIPLALGVTDVARWQQLEGPLVKAIRALSEDTLRFYPLRLPEHPEGATSLPDLSCPITSESSKKPDSVCLFSGGVDSFVGAAHLLSNHRRPLLVSHAVGPVSGLQKELFKGLQEFFPKLEPHWLVQVRAHPNTTRIKREAREQRPYWHSRDSLNRLRSMFFFSIAGIIAQGIDVDDIFMCENGLIGAAIVFAPSDDTPFNTRPAEPHYLRAMERFLRQALDRPRLRILNPFQYMTKGEVVSYGAGLGLQGWLYRTVSCWRSGNCGLSNCGQCTPCLFRQLAFDEAGFPPPPRKYGYRYPIPKKNWRGWNSKELERLEDIRAYCSQAIEGGKAWLLSNELAVIDAVDVSGGADGIRNPHRLANLDKVAPRKMAEMILRFARATLKRLP